MTKICTVDEKTQNDIFGGLIMPTPGADDDMTGARSAAAAVNLVRGY